MKTVCESSSCVGCKACLNACTQNAISYNDLIDRTECVIDEEQCINCGKCYSVCQNYSITEKKTPICYYQGWAEDRIRSVSSSGGAATAIMEGFIKNGGYVCSCAFEEGEFIFKGTNNISELKQFSGSKYVKSDLQNAYDIIGDLIKSKERILFIGLPCQSAAILNYFNRNENLYTVDLICHGTPSPKLLINYLKEFGLDPNKIDDVKFRNKDFFETNNENEEILPGRVKDSYLSMFMDAVNYTENCYFCKYASFDRVSDITLGDAWGQLSEDRKEGVSLILCQTQKGEKLLEMTKLMKYDVDIKKAVEFNHQLRRPSMKHPRRDYFLRAIKNGHSFRYAAFVANPKRSLKESIKFGLIKLHILPDKKSGEYKLRIKKHK